MNGVDYFMRTNIVIQEYDRHFPPGTEEQHLIQRVQAFSFEEFEEIYGDLNLASIRSVCWAEEKEYDD